MKFLSVFYVVLFFNAMLLYQQVQGVDIGVGENIS